MGFFSAEDLFWVKLKLDMWFHMHYIVILFSPQVLVKVDLEKARKAYTINTFAIVVIHFRDFVLFLLINFYDCCVLVKKDINIGL